MQQARSAPTPRPAASPRRWSHAAFAWLTQTGQPQTPFVQERLLLLLPDGPALTLMLVAWSVALPALCIALFPSLAAWLLLGAMLVLDVAVVHLQRACDRALRDRQPPPWRALLAARAAWFVGLSCSAWLALATGHVALAVLAGGVVMSFNGYVACRLAGFPRLATLLLLVTWCGMAAGLWMSPLSELRLLCWLAPFGFAGKYTLMRMQHALLISGLQAHDANQRQARHDALTGLPNRRYLWERLTALCAGPPPAEAPGATFAVLAVDLDAFKDVNDTHGHEAGDRLLVAIAAHMQQLAGPHDLVARLGGDEFVMLLPGMDAAGAAGVAARLVRAIHQPVEICPQVRYLGRGSVGVAVAPPQGCRPDDLLKAADQALYAAKRAGKGCWATA